MCISHAEIGPRAQWGWIWSGLLCFLLAGHILLHPNSVREARAMDDAALAAFQELIASIEQGIAFLYLIFGVPSCLRFDRLSQAQAMTDSGVAGNAFGQNRQTPGVYV